MKERPILFSAPMVRALLDGRKTQTRRVVKPQPADICLAATWSAQKAHPEMPLPDHPFLDEHGRAFALLCPYGATGDQLWVRETHSIGFDSADRPILASALAGAPKNHMFHAAPIKHPGAPAGAENWCLQWKRRPSIHMPRWASRMDLEVTCVRVERLQSISEADALAEGIVALHGGGFGLADGSHFHADSARIAYWSLWEAINGKGSVDPDPWVWVVVFRRVRP